MSDLVSLAQSPSTSGTPPPDGAGRLPNGYLAALVERTGKSRRELTYRMQFAEEYPTEPLFNALNNGTSWREVAKSLKADQDAESNEPAEPPVVPDGKFSTPSARAPAGLELESPREAAAESEATSPSR